MVCGGEGVGGGGGAGGRGGVEADVAEGGVGHGGEVQLPAVAPAPGGAQQGGRCSVV